MGHGFQIHRHCSKGIGRSLFRTTRTSASPWTLAAAVKISSTFMSISSMYGACAMPWQLLSATVFQLPEFTRWPATCGVNNTDELLMIMLVTYQWQQVPKTLNPKPSSAGRLEGLQLNSCIRHHCSLSMYYTATHHGACAVDQEAQVHSLLPGAELCRRLADFGRHASIDAVRAVVWRELRLLDGIFRLREGKTKSRN